MNKRKKLEILSGLLGSMLLLFISALIYLKSVTVVEPFTVRIAGITMNEAKSIGIYSVTPLDKKINIPYDKTANEWVRDDDGAFKTINIFIPDSLKSKISLLYVNTKHKEFIVSLKELQVVGQSGGKNEYSLPTYVRSNISIFKMMSLLLHVHIIAMFFLILEVMVFILLAWCLIYILIKKRRTIWSIFRIKISSARKTIKNFVHRYSNVIRWLKIIVFSIFIACCLFYGYFLIKYTVSFYITTVLFILCSGIILWLILQLIFRIFKVTVRYSQWINRTLIVFLVIWLFWESILRFNGFNISYLEKIVHYYASGYYANPGNSNLLVHSRNEKFVVERKEYSYEIKCNAEGLRDIDHPVEKEKNEYRIICIGNSFTEGYGAPQDSTWPKLFENRIKTATGRKIVVFNAGVSTSDPFFEYMLLKEKMLKYEPDLVLLTLGGSDFTFYRTRGGFERFTEEGLKYREGPRWEKLYAVSYVFRYYLNNKLHYRDLLSPTSFAKDSIRALKDFDNCINRFYQLSLESKFKLVVVFYDDDNTVYFVLMNKLKQDHLIQVIDLFEYNKSIEKINARDRKYWWPIDWHYNSSGYDIMAKGVLWNLNEMGIIDSIGNHPKQDAGEIK